MLKAPEAPEEGKELDRRSKALKEALLAKLPEDDNDSDDEDKGIALLASMLGYYRQEEKNAWWEHFRLRDLPADEHLDEREMVAGLQAKTGKKHVARRNYTFPLQECSIRERDKVFFVAAEDPAGLDAVGNSFKVEEIDTAAGTMTVSGQGAGRCAAHPSPSAIPRGRP